MTRSTAKRPLKSLRDYAAAAKRRGWPDVIGARDYVAEFAELDVLTDANERAGRATQAQIAKLPQFRRLTAAAQGTLKLRRLTLAAMQGLVWYWNDPDCSWRRLVAVQNAANALLQRTARDADDLYVMALLRLVDAGPWDEDVDADEDAQPWLIDLYPRIIACAAPVIARGGRPDRESASVLRDMREPMLRSHYNKRYMRDGAALIERLLAQ